MHYYEQAQQEHVHNAREMTENHENQVPIYNQLQLENGYKNHEIMGKQENQGHPYIQLQQDQSHIAPEMMDNHENQVRIYTQLQQEDGYGNQEIMGNQNNQVHPYLQLHQEPSHIGPGMIGNNGNHVRIYTPLQQESNNEIASKLVAYKGLGSVLNSNIYHSQPAVQYEGGIHDNNYRMWDTEGYSKLSV